VGLLNIANKKMTDSMVCFALVRTLWKQLLLIKSLTISGMILILIIKMK